MRAGATNGFPFPPPPLQACDFGLSDFFKPDQRFSALIGSAYYVVGWRPLTPPAAACLPQSPFPRALQRRLGAASTPHPVPTAATPAPRPLAPACRPPRCCAAATAHSATSGAWA